MRRVAAASVLVVLAALAAGCTSTITGSPSTVGSSPSASGSTDAARWADSFCRTITDMVTSLVTEPPSVDGADLAKAKTSFSQYLGDLSTKLDTGITNLKKVGPAPITGGDDALNKLVTFFGTVKTAVDDSKTLVDRANAADPAQFADVFQQVATKLSVLTSVTNPLQDVRYPELERALGAAPACRTLENMESSASPTPTTATTTTTTR